MRHLWGPDRLAPRGRLAGHLMMQMIGWFYGLLIDKGSAENFVPSIPPTTGSTWPWAWP